MTLSSCLAENGRLPAADLSRAERIALESSEKLSSIVTRLGLISEAELVQILRQALQLPLVLPEEMPLSPVLEDRISPRFLKAANIIPLEDGLHVMKIAVVDPFDREALDAMVFATGKPLDLRLACASDLEAAWDRLYGSPEAGSLSAQSAEEPSDDIERLKDLASEAPVIRLVNQMIARAAEARSSDIHIEQMEGRLRVRYRIDGVLQEMESPPVQLGAALVSRIKVMAKLNIAERRLAQDGRIRLPIRGQDIDLRVSTTPTIHGEGVVLRILDRGAMPIDFAGLGFEAPLMARLEPVLARPHGIVLSTGPTGSGKTTTLYAALRTLNTAERKILTIEDPVEYQIAGINQLQVKPQIGLTFGNALRSFLRQDPDVMMIGEIRDLETAQIAVQAALTGHLILSTLHTNDAASAVTRLLDMGVEDYLLTSTVNAVLGQRLVRVLCPQCREGYRPIDSLADRLNLRELGGSQEILLYHPVGCSACNGTGFRGRTSIVEILIMSDPLRQMVLQKAEARQIQRQAVAEGMETMQYHGLRKALAGITTIEEVLRATSGS